MRLSENRPPGAVEAVFQCQVLEVNKPDGRIKCPVIDRQACQPAVAEHLHQFILGDGRGHRDDIGLGDRRVLDRHAAQVADARLTFGPRACALLVIIQSVVAGAQRPENPAEKPRPVPLLRGRRPARDALR